MNDPIQEIKSKLDIVSLVQRYVPLKKAGRYYKACCPFHQEKTPSFFVNPERQIAYCFSCQKGGDHFQFVQQIENLDFRGALELLGEMTGTEIQKEISPVQMGKNIEKKEKKQRLLDIHESATLFFQKNLWESSDGAKVLDYLKARGLQEATIKAFRLGFASPQKEALSAFLLAQGFSQEDCLDSGLSLSRNLAGVQLVDRFQLRLMIPIMDLQSKVIAFGGRALKQGDQPKYLNSPETPLYDKSATLFYLDSAKVALRHGGPVCIVEGYFDVMASVQAGAPAVVASCGTALTKKQFLMLKRYTTEVILALDADQAGQDALLRALEVAVPLGFHLRVVQLEQAKDAAELAKENPEAWLEALAKAKHWLQFFHEKKQEGGAMASLEGQKRYTQEMLQLLQWSPSFVEKEFYLKEMSKILQLPLDYLQGEMQNIEQNRPKLKARPLEVVLENTEGQRENKRVHKMIQESLALLLLFPKEFFSALEQMAQNPTSFLAYVKTAGFFQRLHLLTPELLQEFSQNFAQHLESFAEESHFYPELSGKKELESIYKQIQEQYNQQADLSSEWISALETRIPLSSYAFALELQNLAGPEASKQCYQMLVLLSLHYQLHHGKNS